MPMMTIFEPLFILLFLATVATLMTATVAALRGRRPHALRVSSRALRVVQRENGAAVHLVDSKGRIYRPNPAEMTVPLDGPVGPGESFDAERRFELPLDATDVRLVYNHEGGFPIGALIIGENQLFHDATVVALDGAVPCSVNSIGTTTPCEPAI